MKINNFHPQSLNDFIGKDQIKNNLNIYIKSALSNATQLDHCLFYGHPGTGKTTLAKIIANELNTNIKFIQGNDIQSKSDIISAISSLSDNDILFIDEIHAVNQQCFEIFYSIMDNQIINIKIGKEGNYKITPVKTPKITIIGATTLYGNIPAPFEDRFGIILYLSLYENHDIYKILKTINNSLELNIDDNDLHKISIYSKGVPRIAKRYLTRYLDYKSIENPDVDLFFKSIGIYEYGLNEIDLEYLNSLNNNGYVGIKTISQIMNIDEKTIISKIEPFLLKQKFVSKEINGRKITKQGIELLNNILR